MLLRLLYCLISQSSAEVSILKKKKSYFFEGDELPKNKFKNEENLY